MNDRTPPRRKILFTDWRDIQCGHLQWLTPDGEVHGVGSPPEPMVEMRAEPHCVPHGIRLAAQPARKSETVEEWKGWGRIIYDGDVYRSWYFEINGIAKLGSGSPAHARPPESVVICGVQSQDGFHWSEPTRSRIDVPGQEGFDGVTFFVDPAAPADERYKFVYCARAEEETLRAERAEYLGRHPRYQDERIMQGGNYCIFAAASPDGVSWTAIPRPLMLHASDTDTTVTWDEALGKYVMYTRMFRDGRRWIGRAEADEFLRWGPIEPIIWPRLDDPPDYDFYLNGYTRYPGCPEYQLMFPMVYHRYTERSEVRLYSSADGIAWHQVPGGPVISAGAPGEWDGEFLGSGKDLVPFGPGRIAIPYSGTEYPHKYPRGPAVWDAWQMAWAWWPQDRLCALEADGEGEFWTMPAVPAGRRVKLNVRVPRAGEVRVGIPDVEGRSVNDCEPIHGDHPDVTVTWRGQPDMGVEEGKPVALHFRVRRAEVFSVRFA